MVQLLWWTKNYSPINGYNGILASGKMVNGYNGIVCIVGVESGEHAADTSSTKT